MNNQLLHRLIRQFSTESLIAFLSDKNSDFEPIRTPLRNYPSEDFSQALEVGELPFGHAESLGVYSFRVNKALSERSGKKAQYDLAKKVLKDAQQDAGIFVFYDAQGNFRFSLVYADYHGTKVDWSTFKRFTYFVSPQLTNITFLQRVGECTFSSLEEIKDAFSVEKVTKKFYEEISYWYFWACQKCCFPKAAEDEENGRQISVIRLITRMIFVWFMREKDLVKPNLFNREIMRGVLKELEDDSSSYYLAILQNLFFATLNTPQKERRFRREGHFNKGYNPDFNNHSVYRHQDLFKQPDKMEELFSDIAFLNGGLFECLDEKDKKIYIDGFTDKEAQQPYVPNDLFFSDEQPADFNTEMGTTGKTYKVKGLLEILNAYNFTIDENTVDDKEVALDPELLGRVFENLLASFNPETSTTARKATGSYYTPREIVDYMVDESLKAYFRSHLPEREDVEEKIEKLFTTDENPFNPAETEQLVKLVESVRLVDPAVGSGAFPMGALNKLVFILSKLDPNNALWKQAQLDVAEQIPDYQLRAKTKETIENYFQEKNPDYGRKLYLIQKCIYGVDIQQIAVEIAKLRFFISLLVEETVEKDKDNWGIEPLPNLDFKIMQGNSPISEYGGLRFELDANKQAADMLAFEDENSKQIKEFEQLKEAYQAEADRAKKKKLQDKIDQSVAQIAENLARKQKEDYFSRVKAIEDKYALVLDSEAKRAAIAVEKEKLAKQSGFDWAAIEAELKQFGSKRKVRPFFPWQLYFAEVFIEKGGFDIVIGNPPYIQLQKNGGALAKLYENLGYETFTRMGDIYCLFYELGYRILCPGGHLCLITSNKWMRAGYGNKLRKFLAEKTDPKLLIDFAGMSLFESATVDNNILLFRKGENQAACKTVAVRSDLKSLTDLSRYVQENAVVTENFGGDDAWIIASSIEDQIRRKIEAKGIPLKDWGINIYYGIKTGYNEAFIIDGQTKDRLIQEDPKSAEIIKPVLRGRDIKRYRAEFADLWLITTFPALHIDIDRYPAVKNYLSSFGKKILQTGEEYIDENGVKQKTRKKTGNRWFETQDQIGYYKEFEKEKIIYAEIVHDQRFYLDNRGYYPEATSFLMTGPHLKYIYALLNSDPVTWIFKKFYAGGGLGKEGFRYKKNFLEDLPIPPPIATIEKDIIDVVEEIIKIAETDDFIQNNEKKQSIKEYEDLINDIIYNLYGFSEDETRYIQDSRLIE
ncbi:MAG: hypothetical protein canaca05_11630 [Anaerolineaceae bacterium]